MANIIIKDGLGNQKEIEANGDGTASIPFTSPSLVDTGASSINQKYRPIAGHEYAGSTLVPVLVDDIGILSEPSYKIAVDTQTFTVPSNTVQYDSYSVVSNNSQISFNLNTNSGAVGHKIETIKVSTDYTGTSPLSLGVAIQGANFTQTTNGSRMDYSENDFMIHIPLFQTVNGYTGGTHTKTLYESGNVNIPIYNTSQLVGLVYTLSGTPVMTQDMDFAVQIVISG